MNCKRWIVIRIQRDYIGRLKPETRNFVHYAIEIRQPANRSYIYLTQILQYYLAEPTEHFPDFRTPDSSSVNAISSGSCDFDIRKKMRR